MGPADSEELLSRTSPSAKGDGEIEAVHVDVPSRNRYRAPWMMYYLCMAVEFSVLKLRLALPQSRCLGAAVIVDGSVNLDSLVFCRSSESS